MHASSEAQTCDPSTASRALYHSNPIYFDYRKDAVEVYLLIF